MTENWKKKTDKGKCVCVLFLDLSKAFDTVNHNLLTAMLGAYSFHRRNTKSYLDNQQQRVYINNNISSRETVFKGVP